MIITQTRISQQNTNYVRYSQTFEDYSSRHSHIVRGLTKKVLYNAPPSRALESSMLDCFQNSRSARSSERLISHRHHIYPDQIAPEHARLLATFIVGMFYPSVIFCLISTYSWKNMSALVDPHSDNIKSVSAYFETRVGLVNNG